MQVQRSFSGCLVIVALSLLACAAAYAAAPQNDAAGALQGIYVGIGIDRSHLGHRIYYFTPDGWVINNIPFVNMDDFNMDSYRNNPAYKLFIGRYRTEGNQIHIVW